MVVEDHKDLQDLLAQTEVVILKIPANNNHLVLVALMVSVLK